MIKEQFFNNKTSWQKSSLSGFSQDDQGNFVPWMTYDAISFLKNYVTKNHSIFEFGCGASTLFFAERSASVTSIETNDKWLKIVNSFLSEKKLENVDINLMPDGIDNNNYETFAKNCDKKFDIIVIDSIKRFSCALNVIEALKPNGIIILDDSERPNYQKIFKFFNQNGFTQTDFLGIAPAQLRIKNTTIFQRKN
ncbi:MAG: class I SAM-dependent methyltransferase [Pelagibacterales bacterium]|nr:class I SAM-dependent methyltransferase [Pelagibacterales bacterium]